LKRTNYSELEIIDLWSRVESVESIM